MSRTRPTHATVRRAIAAKPATSWPEQRPADCYDWLPPEQVVRLALGAYYMASRRLDKLPDDPTQERLEFNNGRAEFAESLSWIFTLKLDEHGFKSGAPGFEDYASDVLKKWSAGDGNTPGDTPRPDIHRTHFKAGSPALRTPAPNPAPRPLNQVSTHPAPAGFYVAFGLPPQT